MNALLSCGVKFDKFGTPQKESKKKKLNSKNITSHINSKRPGGFLRSFEMGPQDLILNWFIPNLEKNL
jgi:hypothetical protein